MFLSNLYAFVGVGACWWELSLELPLVSHKHLPLQAVEEHFGHE